MHQTQQKPHQSLQQTDLEPYQKAKIPLFRNVKLINGDRVFQNLLKQTYVQRFQQKQAIPWFQKRKFFVYIHQVSGSSQVDTLRSQTIIISQVGLKKSLIKSFFRGQYWGYQDYGLCLEDRIQVQAQPGCLIYFCSLQHFYLSFRRVIPLNTIQSKVQLIKKIFIYVNDILKTQATAGSRRSKAIAQHNQLNDQTHINIQVRSNSENAISGFGKESLNFTKLMPYIQRRISKRSQVIFRKDSKIQFLYFLFDGKCQRSTDQDGQQKQYLQTTRVNRNKESMSKTIQNFRKNIQLQQAFRKYSKYQKYHNQNKYDFKNYEQAKSAKTYFHSMANTTNRQKHLKCLQNTSSRIFSKNVCLGLEQVLNGQEYFRNTVKSIHQSQFLLIPKERFQKIPQIRRQIKKVKDFKKLNALVNISLKDNDLQAQMDILQGNDIQTIHYRLSNEEQKQFGIQFRKTSYNFRIKTQNGDDAQVSKPLKRPLTAQNDQRWKLKNKIIHNTQGLQMEKRLKFYEQYEQQQARNYRTKSSFMFAQNKNFDKKVRAQSSASRGQIFINNYHDRKSRIKQNQIIKYVKSKAPELMINPDREFAVVKPLHTKQSNYIRNYKRKLKKYFMHSELST